MDYSLPPSSLKAYAVVKTHCFALSLFLYLFHEPFSSLGPLLEIFYAGDIKFFFSFFFFFSPAIEW